MNKVTSLLLLSFQLVMSSDKLSSLQEPVLSLDMDVQSNTDKQSVSVELGREDLKKLIASLDAANKVWIPNSDATIQLTYNLICIKIFVIQYLSKYIFGYLIPLEITSTCESRHEISNNVVCLMSKGSDQPVHMRSLIRAFC